jgi:hypothetical protein
MAPADVLTGVDDDVIARHLMDKYGLLLGRQALAEVLKFPTADAFDRYFQRGHLELPVLRFPGRRGVYVLATDVAHYLVKSSRGEKQATA